MSDDIYFSRKNERKINEFVGLEFLYDYMSNKLDAERMSAFDKLVKESREVQDEIHNITRALNYVEELSHAEVTESLVQEIRTPNSYMQGFFQKIHWGQWPSGIKLGIEVVIVAIGVVSIIIIVPWHRIIKFQYQQSSEVIISEVQKDLKKAITGELEVGEKLATPAELVYQDENSEQTKPKTENNAQTQPVETKAPVVSMPKNNQEKQQGFLYRGTISVSNLQATTQKFVEKIGQLGGRKAGEVELGWKKGDGTYFHFTVPESKYDQLTKYLSEYGKLKLQKEKHDRIMPEGIIRIIISVSENTKKASKNETDN